ncbi:MAG: hypothetical protein H7838_03015 [Magnetococcus sp. DMHC-8]
MTLEENDRPVVRAGGGDEVIELALMFDLTGQEMEAVEDAGSFHADGPGEAGSGEGVVQSDLVTRETMTRQAEGEQWGALSRAVVTGRGEESASLQEVNERGAAGADSGLARGRGAGDEAAPMDNAWQQSGMAARQLGVARLATEFLGPPPGGPLPETPVMEPIEPLFPEEEELPVSAADSEHSLHEMDEVSPLASAWSDPVPEAPLGRAARRVMPWLPSAEGESTEGLLREPEGMGRGGASRHATGAQAAQRMVGRSDLEDTEPFDLQHVALITEGKVRKDVFRRTENLGDEIIVRLTLPVKQAAEPVVESRSAEVQRFSPEMLVSVFAQSAEDEREEMEQTAVVPEVVPEVAAEEAEVAEVGVPWVGDNGVEELSTIPVWQTDGIDPVAEPEPEPEPRPKPEPVPDVPMLDAVVLEPFDVDDLDRVVHGSRATVGRGSARRVVGRDVAELEGNPWFETPTAPAGGVVATTPAPLPSWPKDLEPFDVARVEEAGRGFSAQAGRLSGGADEREPVAWGDNPWGGETAMPVGMVVGDVQRVAPAQAEPVATEPVAVEPTAAPEPVQAVLVPAYRVEGMASRAGASGGALEPTGIMAANTLATAAEANVLAGFAKKVAYSVADTAANLVICTGLDRAVHIMAMTAATVAEAAIIERARNSGVKTYNITDTAANLAASSSAVLSLAGVVTASTLATAAEANIFAGFAKAVVYSVADVAARVVACAGLNRAVNITATTPVTLVEAAVIEAAHNSGVNTYDIADTATNLAAVAEGLLAPAGRVLATTPASAAEADRLAGFAKPVVYHVVDTAVRLAASVGLHKAVNVGASTAATVAEAAVIAEAGNRGGKSYDIEDTAAHLTGAPAHVLALAGTVTASTPAKGGEASILAGFAKPVVYSIADTAANLVISSGLDKAVDIRATTPATIAEAVLIDAARNSGGKYYDVVDTTQNLMVSSSGILTLAGTVSGAEATLLAGSAKMVVYSIADTAAQVAASKGLDKAVHITATTAATVAEAMIIQAARNSGVKSCRIADTAAHLAAATEGTLAQADQVTAVTAATAMEAGVLAGFAKPVLYSVVDTAANLVLSTGLNKAVNITATTPALVTEAMAISMASNSGDKIFHIADTAANLVAASDGLLALAGTVTANTLATGVEAGLLAGMVKTVVYSVADTAARVAASTGLNKAVNITATTAALVAEAVVIQGAGNRGVKTCHIVDTATRLVAMPERLLALVGQVTASTLATGEEAAILANFAKPVVYSIADTAAQVAASGGLHKAVDITATTAATVAEAMIIAAAGNSGSKTFDIEDSAAHLAGAEERLLMLAGTVRANTLATSGEATVLAGFVKPVEYSIADVAAQVVTSTGLQEAVDITATTAATMAAAKIIVAAGNRGSRAFDIRDTATNLAAGPEHLLLLAGRVTANTLATGAEATVLAGFAKPVVYSIADTAGQVAASSGLHRAVDITVTTDATVAEATIIQLAGNSGKKMCSVTDTAAHLAAVVGGFPLLVGQVTASTTAKGVEANVLAGYVGTVTYSITDTASQTAASLGLNRAVDITVSTPATVAEAAIIGAAGNSGRTTFDIVDTAAHLAASSNAVLRLAGAVTANTPATGAEATLLAGFAKAVAYSVSDTAANLVASAGLSKAINITATTAVTVAEAMIIEAAGNTGANRYDIADTAANLAASSDAVFALAGTVTAKTLATGVEATILAGFVKPVVYSISDTAANIVASTGLHKAVNITATTPATVAEAAAIDMAGNSGIRAYDMVGTAGGLPTESSAPLTLRSAVTGAEASLLASFARSVTYSVSDTAANLLASTGLHKAENITATTPVTLAEAALIEAVGNSGVNTYNIADTAANLVTSADEVRALAGVVTASTPATAAEASVFAGFAKPVVYSVSDTAAQLAASTGLHKAVDIVATTAATVAEAKIILAAGNSGSKVYDVLDSAAHLAAAPEHLLVRAGKVTANTPATGAEATILAGFAKPVVYSVADMAARVVASTGLHKAVDILTATTATVAEATVIAMASNGGSKTYDIVDTAAHLATVSERVLAPVGTMRATTPATGAEASVFAGFAKSVLYDITDTAAQVAASTGLNKAVNITATTAATVAEAVRIAVAGNRGSKVFDIEDSAAHLAAAAEHVLELAGQVTANTPATAAEAGVLAAFAKTVVYNVADTAAQLVTSTGLHKAVDIVATTPARVAEAGIIQLAGNRGSKACNVEDTAANLATVVGGFPLLVGAVTASTPATAVQAGVLAGFTRGVVYSVADEAAQVAAAGVALNRAVDITATTAATVAEAMVIAAADNSGCKTFDIIDSAAHLAASSNAVLQLARTVTANTLATGAEATVLAAFAKEVVYSIADTAGHVAASTGLQKAVNIQATTAATVAEAMVMVEAGNVGSVAFDIADTSAHLVAARGDLLALAGQVTATTPATGAEATVLAGFAKTVVYNVVDTAAHLAASGGLHKAVNIQATTEATEAEAVCIKMAGNSGAKSYRVAGTSPVVAETMPVALVGDMVLHDGEGTLSPLAAEFRDLSGLDNVQMTVAQEGGADAAFLMQPLAMETDEAGGHEEAATPPAESESMVEMLSVMRETARLTRESAMVMRESAVLSAESANVMLRAVRAPATDLVAARPEKPVVQAPTHPGGSRQDRVVVPVEKLFSGLSNALGDMVGSVVGRRSTKKR